MRQQPGTHHLLRRVWARVTDEQVSPVGMSLFRICYSIILLCEVSEMYKFRHLLFDEIPYLVTNDISFGPVLIAWMATLVCLILGLFTRTATVVNYVMTLLTFSTFHEFEYHMDYVYTGTNLLLIFLPISRRLSIDALLTRRANSAGVHSTVNSPTVSMGYYYALNLISIGLVYVDSVFYKLNSPMWTGGLGFWKPASFPQNTWWDIGAFLDFEFAVMLGGYVTLVFEIVYIFLMWSRIFRPLLFVIGVALHIGITLVFPIPWFGLAVTGVYLTMIPPHWLERLLCYVTRQPPPEKIADSNNPAATQRDWNLVAIAVLVVVFTVSQSLMIMLSPGAKKICHLFGMERFQESVAFVARKYHPLIRTTIGVTPHPVFMDAHFDGYKHVFAVVHVNSQGTEEWLPLITQEGRAGSYNTGRQFVYWSWRVCGPNMSEQRFSAGLRNLTSFWIHNQPYVLIDNAHFKILVKDVEPPFKWEKGHYTAQQAKPWRTVARASWIDRKFHFIPKLPHHQRRLIKTKNGQP